MPGTFGFLQDGWGELGRKMTRLRLRRRLAAEDRERDEALIRLGRTAWEAKVDLAQFAEVADKLGRLDTRAGELAANAERLGARRSELLSQRQAEVERFDSLLQAARAAKTTADRALAAARSALAEQDRTIGAAETRLGRVATDLARTSAPAASQSGAATREVEPLAREHLETEQKALQERAAAARAARPPLAADVDRLETDVRARGNDVAGLEREKKAALLPIDHELKRVQEESGGAARESTTVGREQRVVFLALGGALSGAQVTDPGLAEARQAVAAVEERRAASRAALDDSLAKTAGIPRGTMAKFYATAVLVPAVMFATAYGVTALRAPSPASSSEATGPAGNDSPASRDALADETRKDAAVQAFLRSPGSEAARAPAVSILKDDILELGSTADPAHLAALTRILRSDQPELRAAAADAIGMIGPAAAQEPALVAALNDPVPAVRHAALGALGQVRDNPAAGLLVERARQASERRARASEEDLDPEATPDAGQLGVRLYPGATFLHYASNVATGLAAFSTPDPRQTLIDFYVAAAGRAALDGEAFTRTYFGGSPDDPTGARRLAAGNEAWLRQAMQSGHPAAAIDEELGRRSTRLLTLPLVWYGNEAIYGAPAFIPLEEREVGGARRALRFVVVFDDRALGQTGFDIHQEKGQY